MTITSKTIYTTDDGMMFSALQTAEKHELILGIITSIEAINLYPLNLKDLTTYEIISLILEQYDII
jgi:hypothetical protein